jgi:hypothetical protein
MLQSLVLHEKFQQSFEDAATLSDLMHLKVICLSTAPQQLKTTYV